MPVARTKRPVGTRSVEVIDGAYEDTFVATFSGLIERLNYGRSDFDVAGMEEYRHFKHEIALDQLDSNPLYRVLRTQVVAEVERAYGAFAPQLTRAYLNLVVFGDHHTPHIDCETGVTAIYYANREWRDEWQGETLFYEGDEPVAAVAPRPGRIALLPADMRHRVGGVSRLCAAARYTAAFKFETEEAVP